jgi:hypothetical protein
MKQMYSMHRVAHAKKERCSSIFSPTCPSSRRAASLNEGELALHSILYPAHVLLHETKKFTVGTIKFSCPDSRHWEAINQRGSALINGTVHMRLPLHHVQWPAFMRHHHPRRPVLNQMAAKPVTIFRFNNPYSSYSYYEPHSTKKCTILLGLRNLFFPQNLGYRCEVLIFIPQPPAIFIPFVLWPNDERLV